MFCYEGTFWSLVPNPVVHIWDQLKVTISNTQYQQLLVTVGNDSTSALASSSGLNVSGEQPVSLSPFTSACVALRHARLLSLSVSYDLRAQFQFCLRYPIMFVMGIFLLFKSPQYSRNAASVYTAGVLIGVLGSVLVLLYLLSRVVPGVSERRRGEGGREVV